MSTLLTIDLGWELAERLRAEADRRGMAVDAVALEAITQNLPKFDEGSHAAEFHDLDSLAGTWTDADAEAFRSATADFERIDLELWK